jgi:hypothetical protein
MYSKRILLTHGKYESRCDSDSSSTQRVVIDLRDSVPSRVSHPKKHRLSGQLDHEHKRREGGHTVNSPLYSMIVLKLIVSPTPDSESLTHENWNVNTQKRHSQKIALKVFQDSLVWTRSGTLSMAS